MKERIENYWYSLRDSTRAMIKVGSLVSLAIILIIGCVLWENLIAIVAFALVIAIIWLLIYVGYCSIKDDEEYKSRRYSERKDKEEYLRNLKSNYDRFNDW